MTSSPTNHSPPRPRFVALVGGAARTQLQPLLGSLRSPLGAAILLYAELGDISLGELQAWTALPVVKGEHGDALTPDRLYVVPARTETALVGGRLRVGHDEPTNPAGAGAADRMLRSLADEHGRDAIAVVLQPDGFDVSLGLKRIKEVGGLTLRADTGGGVDDLPRDLHATIDLSVPPADLGSRIAALAFDQDDEAIEDERPQQEVIQDALRDILTLVRIRSGHDFSHYKRATLYRRVSRRMQVCQTDSIAQYHRHLRENPSELTYLLRDFLISVTNFFRDPDAFDALNRKIIPRLFAGKRGKDQVRVWVAGCATGEEAYSIGMLLAEHAAQVGVGVQPQIFATDIDEESLAEARAGRYPEAISIDVSPERLERFFERDGSAFRVRKELREIVLFSPHNVLRDPPFSRLDLVSCRNLLIYLNRDAQDRVLNMFHFGLRPEGTLLLGSSESAENAALQFAAVDGKHRIFSRRTTPSALGFDTLTPGARWQISMPAPVATGSERPLAVGELHHRLVEQYAPPSVLVNEELEVIHLSEHAGPFFNMSGGEPTRQLLRLVLPPLRLDLRSAIYAARESGAGADTRLVRFDHDGKPRMVELHVRAADLPELGRGMLLVLFRERDPGAEDRTVVATTTDPTIEPVVRQIEDELHRTRDQLRTTIEQYETSLEELKASNEELHAINEELRSATEELETSKEELQSVNEELTTLNHELKNKVDEVSRANSDLQNLMTSTDIGVVFLDRSLNIKRFTPRAQDLINVIASDVGRPLAHLTHRLDCHDLPAAALEVLAHLRMVERKVTSHDGRRYLARLLPYRSLEDRIEGVVLTFVNVTELKEAEAALRRRDETLRLAERAAEAGIWELDLGSERISMSPEWARIHGVDNATEITLAGWMDRIDERDCPVLRAAVEAAIESGDELNLEVRIDHPRQGTRSLWVLGRAGTGPGGRKKLAGITVDVTARRRTEAALVVSEERFRQALQSAPLVALSQDASLRFTWGYVVGREIDFTGKTDVDVFGPTEAARLIALKREVMQSGQSQRAEIELEIDGERRTFDFWIEPVAEDGASAGVRSLGFDITPSKLAETMLRDAARRKDEFLATLSHELRNPLTPLRAALDIQRLGADDPARVDRARGIMERQVEHLIKLVDDLLDLSRITQNKVSLHCVPIELTPVVEAAIEATRPGLDGAGHRLHLELEPGPIRILGDATRLTQVVVNLLTNAIKFTPAGGDIRVELQRDGERRRAVLRVRDSGVGMDGELLPRVFEVFVQARDVIGKTTGGLGLGLNVVRRMVELHGGTVVAHSGGLGHGSEFVVELPLLDGAP